MRNEPKDLSLSAPDRNSRDLVERYAIYQAAAEPAETPEQVLPLSHYLWILRRHKWALLAFVAVAVAATVIVSSRITPVYESTATLDVDRLVPTGIIGQ